MSALERFTAGKVDGEDVEAVDADLRVHHRVQRPVPHADTLTVVHHDDTRTRYTDVRYQLIRDGIRIWSDEGEHAFTDILMTHAYRQRPASD